MMPGDIFCVSCGQYHASLSICPNIRLTASNATFGDRRRGPRDRRAAPSDALTSLETSLRLRSDDLEAAEKRESMRFAWLIEKPGSPPVWFAGGDGTSGVWTGDARNAIWFSRKYAQWALKALRMDDWGFVITEHGFERTPTPPAQEGKP